MTLMQPPLASFCQLVKATTGQPTGCYQLTVGDLIVCTEPWNEAAAAKWLPIIAHAVNTYAEAPSPACLGASNAPATSADQ